jgi:hypothetical protein
MTRSDNLIFDVCAADLEYRPITIRRLQALERLGGGFEKWVGDFHRDQECWLRIYDDGGKGRIVQRSIGWFGECLDPEWSDGFEEWMYYLHLEHANPSKSEIEFAAEYGHCMQNAYDRDTVESEFHLPVDCPITKSAAVLRRKQRLGDKFPAWVRANARPRPRHDEEAA